MMGLVRIGRVGVVAGLVGCALATRLCAVPLPAPPAAAAPRPSAIVLITVDALRADRVSFDGYRLPTTPFLDRLSRQGVVFESAYATSSWTPPTMASIFTGVPPMTHGLSPLKSKVWVKLLPKLLQRPLLHQHHSHRPCRLQPPLLLGPIRLQICLQIVWAAKPIAAM